MQDAPFPQPVTLYARESDGCVRPVVITTAREAFRTLTSGPRLPLGDPVWHAAFDKIVKASLDPTPERIEEARAAFLQLVALIEPEETEGRRSLH